MQRAQGIRRGQGRARVGDFEGIGLILVKFLNLVAGVLGANDEGRIGGIDALLVQLHTSLSADLIEESGDTVVKTGVSLPGTLASTHGGKRLIDDKLAGPDLNLRGYGHEVE